MQVNVGNINSDGASDSPKTIDELKLWYFNNNLPPAETTRFFIGVNYLDPKAFGIYKEDSTGNFIVYKNKDDGSRTIRYKGPDEAKAVNELYERLKAEVLSQKNNEAEEDDDDEEEEEEEKTTKKSSKSEESEESEETKESSNSSEYKSTLDEPKKSSFVGIAIFAAIVIGVIMLIVNMGGKPKRGYYNYDNSYYYYQSGTWYKYETSWVKQETKPENLDKDSKKYFVNSDYNTNYGIQNFEESIYYVAPSSSEEVNNTNTNWTSNESWNSNATNTSSDW